MSKYTCPMHPEIMSDRGGRCEKCGMALIPFVSATPPASTISPQSSVSFFRANLKPKTIIQHHSEDKGLGPITWKNYIPLIVIVLMIFVASLITASRGEFSFLQLILNFMTGFFLVFAGFKLMDLKGFADGYFTYDLIASRFYKYGYVYPFIELAFGLLMLAGYHPVWLLVVEFAVMALSGIGVTIKLSKGEEFQCACLGTFLKVPLTYVTIVEDFGMAFLAIVAISL